MTNYPGVNRTHTFFKFFFKIKAENVLKESTQSAFNDSLFSTLSI